MKRNSSKKSSAFAYDYYRMTGNNLNKTPKDFFNILFKHSLKYMWWWRKKEHPVLKAAAKLQLLRYSRKYGLEIGNAHIGNGLYLGHPYNITVNELATIGSNVNIHKGVTIGAECRGARCGAPTIGDRVYIGINATVVGKISIGDDVMIAPNSFVNFDVPSHSIVIGNPAKIISRSNATESYINFLVPSEHKND